MWQYVRDGDNNVDLWVEGVVLGVQDDLPERSDGRQDHETHPKDDADPVTTPWETESLGLVDG